MQTIKTFQGLGEALGIQTPPDPWVGRAGYWYYPVPGYHDLEIRAIAYLDGVWYASQDAPHPRAFSGTLDEVLEFLQPAIDERLKEISDEAEIRRLQAEVSRLKVEVSAALEAKGIDHNTPQESLPEGLRYRRTGGTPGGCSVAQRWGEGDHHGLVHYSATPERWDLEVTGGFLLCNWQGRDHQLEWLNDRVARWEAALEATTNYHPLRVVSALAEEVTVAGVTYQPAVRPAVAIRRYGYRTGHRRGLWVLNDEEIPTSVENIPAPQRDVVYLVSREVFAATDRKDVVTPATDHPQAERKDGVIHTPFFLGK